MNKKDMLLIVLIGCFAIGLFLLFGHKENGSRVVITVDGAIYGEYALSDAQTIMVDTSYGRNDVIIDGGQVWIQEADCKDLYCVKQGKISKTNDRIICLPHKLVVEITSQTVDDNAKDTETVDAVVQ